MQVTKEFFSDMVSDGVQPKDVFLAFTVNQSGGVVNACSNLGVDVVKCNAHRLNSATIRALGMWGNSSTCKNAAVGKLMSRLAACVRVFSHPVVNNDERKEIQQLQEDCFRIYQLIARNDTRYCCTLVDT